MKTKYIVFDPHGCLACWECVEACPKQVIGKVQFLAHRHAKIVRTADCIGCKKCVKTCMQHCFAATAQ